MPCLGDVACISATLATDATHLEDGDTSFPLILLLRGFGFTGDEVSVLSSISATLATDATHATHSENGEVQNGPINDDKITSDSAQPSTKVNPQSEVGVSATRIESITEHSKHEYDKDPSTDVTCNNSSIDSNNKLGIGYDE